MKELFMSRRRKSKNEKEKLFQLGPYAQVDDRKSLMEHLRKDENPYHERCLKLMEREKSLINVSLYDEQHHIIPTSEGGPDEPWNLVHVTYAEHCELHKVRYSLYQLVSDKNAYLARENLPVDFKQLKTESSLRGHDTMKRENIGWYNTEVQRELGKRSGGKKTPAREMAYQQQAQNSDKYASIFERSLTFTFRDEKKTVSVQSSAGQFQRTGHIKDFLIQSMPENHPMTACLEQDKYFTSNFNKVLRGLRPELYAKKDVRPTYKGWSVQFTALES